MDVSMSSLNHVLSDFVQYLENERDAGRGMVEVPVEVLNELGVMPKKATVPVSKEAVKIASLHRQVNHEHLPGTTGLEEIKASIAACKKCSLHKSRTNVVPGQGSVSPEIMFVGEAPGADEDLQGLAFVGRAGQLLTKMIEAMGYKREEVFIGNILKCRPPDNRPPMPDEMEVCLPFLKAQIAVIKPKVIIALGSTAVKGLLNLTTGITKLRGKWLSFEGIDLMPTYHPAYLLRNPPAKKEVWDDLQEVLRHLGRTPPPVKKR